MTPPDLLTFLESKTPQIPLIASPYETIVNWERYLDSLRFTIAEIDPKKKSYHTALELAEKVAGVLNGE